MTLTPNYQRFIDLIRVVRDVPPEKFDMERYPVFNGCGCAAAHYRAEGFLGYQDTLEEHLCITNSQRYWLFGSGRYDDATGTPAKLELLRRIREVLGLPKREALEPKP